MLWWKAHCYSPVRYLRSVACREMLIGLTGGVGSGKSTVCDILRSKGYHVIDADRISRKVVQPGKDAYSLIVRNFGTKILNHDAGIDRKRLAQVVFSDAKKRSVLNAIVHPYVKYEIVREIIKYCWMHPRSIVVLEIPLLFEAGWNKLVDMNVVVYCSEETQLKRLMLRDPSYTKKHAQDRINAQMKLDKKTKLADFLINNQPEGTDQLPEQVLEMLNQAEHARSPIKDFLRLALALMFFIFYWIYLKIKLYLFW